MLLQGRLLCCWSLCTTSYFYKICLMAAPAYTDFWWRIRKYFFCFTGLPSDNFARAFTISLEQRTFWSSFKSIGSALLLHCCNYDILYNIFTAFQGKKLQFFFWIHYCFHWKSASALFNFSAFKLLPELQCTFCIKNKKWQGKRQISGLTLTLAVWAKTQAGRFLTFLFRKGELSYFCGHNKWDMNGDLNFNCSAL